MQLAAMGAHIDEWGMSFDKLPSNPLDVYKMPREPMVQRQRGWWATVDKQRAASLAKHPEHGERIVQCAGDKGGAFLNASPAEMGFSLTDAEFRTGLRMRLGQDVCLAGPCQHSSRLSGSKGPVCGAMLDRRGVHATP